MKTPEFYTVLGCTVNANDQSIIQCYNTMKIIYPNNGPVLMDALLDLVKLRKSMVLEEFAVMERSRGVISQTELNAAYRLFSGYINQDTPARSAVERYKRAIEFDPLKKEEYTEALRLIANHRDCYITKFYLSNSMFPPFMDEMETEVVMDLPAGLNNIGNT
jgi:A repeated domain in UCH-protein